MRTNFTRLAIAAVAGAVALLNAAAAQALGVPGQGTWETTLQARDIDRDGVTDAFYDTALNITWLRNANINGPANWDSANTWASTLVVGGIGGWRLPTMIDTGTPGCNFSNAGGTDCGYNVQTRNGKTVFSEMAYLWYDELGNKTHCPPGDIACAGAPQPGSGLTNTGDFENLQSDYYWTGLQYALFSNNSWYFATRDGLQTYDQKVDGLYALAVHAGDVAPIPEPETLPLMLAGLATLAAVRRRRH